MEFREIIVKCFTCIVVVAGVSGCTYTVTQSNDQYYRTMQQCIDQKGTFVPGKGNSEAACVIH
jgi:hypothetical protein